MSSCLGLRNPPDCRSPEPKPFDDQQRASAQSRQGRLQCPRGREALSSRRKRCRQAFRLEDQALQTLLQARLEEGWSPEQIRGRESLAVSVTTIYRAVQFGRLSFDARKHLRRRGKPYRRKTRQDGRGVSGTAFPSSFAPGTPGSGLTSETGRWTPFWASRGQGAWLPWLTERLACCWQQR